MDEHLPAPLAARREALLRQCADQRDQLALEVYSLRAPLDGGPVGAVRGAWKGTLERLQNRRLRLPLIIGALATGALIAQRKPLLRRGRALAAKAQSMWTTARPLLEMLRRR